MIKQSARHTLEPLSRGEEGPWAHSVTQTVKPVAKWETSLTSLHPNFTCTASQKMSSLLRSARTWGPLAQEPGADGRSEPWNSRLACRTFWTPVSVFFFFFLNHICNIFKNQKMLYLLCFYYVYINHIYGSEGWRYSSITEYKSSSRS